MSFAVCDVYVGGKVRVSERHTVGKTVKVTGN